MYSHCCGLWAVRRACYLRRRVNSVTLLENKIGDRAMDIWWYTRRLGRDGSTCLITVRTWSKPCELKNLLMFATVNMRIPLISFFCMVCDRETYKQVLSTNKHGCPKLYMSFASRSSLSFAANVGVFGRARSPAIAHSRHAPSSRLCYIRNAAVNTTATETPKNSQKQKTKTKNENDKKNAKKQTKK